MVTPQNLEQYAREGYTLCPELIGGQDLERMTRHIEAYIDRQTAAGIRPEHLDKPHLHDATFLDLCAMPAVLDAVEQFIGPDIVLFSCHIICKAKGDGLEVPWHQDAIYWPLEPMEVITLWLAIDDSTVENGCMRVIPGTHTAGPIEHVNIEHPETKVLHRGIPAEQVDVSRAVDCVIPRGGCSFHAPYLIHGSAPNRSTRRRCGFTMRFMPATTRLVREGPLSKWFKDYPLYLLRGRDSTGCNTYALR
ncbi:MAG TPA: phytanoyl-CoA dioxygenase family protein [Phycisphaerae bacterium]|nr:phytanoyl-CoA dioxygenase family protein [Phycisphaerae bacterium]HOJ73239.1 phytanoyl-CoA dioxygenase family protein [Phycisphaerae bacterium]HOM51195.1 phytanoyl-CoA dioxygenase family protein [Phycisphaerae bacterium]HON65742.1 phytanoyl-CoA dioxygenase family protein [Phycisphaerae bacterium]HOQ85303.1 phytanoyl-CoA dioxygenase family protein [Phycisphaerae bacterium]